MPKQLELCLSCHNTGLVRTIVVHNLLAVIDFSVALSDFNVTVQFRNMRKTSQIQ